MNGKSASEFWRRHARTSRNVAIFGATCTAITAGLAIYGVAAGRYLDAAPAICFTTANIGLVLRWVGMYRMDMRFAGEAEARDTRRTITP